MDGGSKAFCKCDDGWTCTITKTEPSKAGKPFSTCSGPCSCAIKEAEPLSQAELSKALEGSPPPNSKAFCVCPEGWSCVLTKTAASDAGKIYFECGEGCVCVVEENNTVKVASVSS